MKKINLTQKTLVLTLIQFIVVSAFAQSDQRELFKRNSFWTETVFNGTIKGKFKWQLDYQYRRMSDASDVTNPSKNLFKNPFQHVYRPWVHYQLNDKVRFSFSPVGFWETTSPAVENNGVKKIQPEYRICPQITLTNTIGRVIIDQRYRYEFRYLGNKVTNEQGEFGYSQGMDFLNSNKKQRFRYFVRAIVPIGKHQKLENNTFYIAVWNEMFLGLGKNTNNDKIWDQNRTFCLLGYKPNINFPMRFEAGYGVQYVNRFNSTFANGILTETTHKIEQNNLLQVYIIFENFNKLFKKK